MNNDVNNIPNKHVANIPSIPPDTADIVFLLNPNTNNSIIMIKDITIISPTAIGSIPLRYNGINIFHNAKTVIIKENTDYSVFLIPLSFLRSIFRFREVL